MVTFTSAILGGFFGNKTTEHFDLTITKEVQEKKADDYFTFAVIEAKGHL